MSSITFWRRGNRECLLKIAESYTLIIVGAGRVLRSEVMASLDKAQLVAQLWLTEETESIFGAVPPL